jgi:hypothetical protein
MASRFAHTLTVAAAIAAAVLSPLATARADIVLDPIPSTGPSPFGDQSQQPKARSKIPNGGIVRTGNPYGVVTVRQRCIPCEYKTPPLVNVPPTPPR